jgi:hypothetical protein
MKDHNILVKNFVVLASRLFPCGASMECLGIVDKCFHYGFADVRIETTRRAYGSSSIPR